MTAGHRNDGKRIVVAPVLALLLLSVMVLPSDLFGARKKPGSPKEGDSEQAKMEYKVQDMLNRGQELLDSKQEERGLKLLSSIPEMFPKAAGRFKAYLVVGTYQSEKRRFDLALRQFSHLAESDDPDEQAEGLYRTGICYFNLSGYDKAFVALRRVTTEFPLSVYANEAYYYIGQCHMKQGHWSKAIEALELVGTSVPVNTTSDQFAEAGQRLYVKVHDKDLVVLLNSQDRPSVVVTTKNGDKQTVTLEPLGKSGEYFIGSIATVPGEPKPGDGVLHILPGDTVTVEYIDQNTEDGRVNVKRISTVQMVSTAVIGFTDGAYREYVHGVFGDQECFIRVKDLGRAGQIKVKLFSDYKVERQEEATGVDLEGEKRQIRDSTEMVLTETGPHTGIFVGKLIPKVVVSDGEIARGPGKLSVMKGDDIAMEYVNEKHILGPDPRTVQYRAKVLVGQIQDVKVEDRVVDSPELKARKNLIEAKIYLRLAQVFKDVGLINKANEKAGEGMDRVEDVISTSLRASMDRKLVEEAFSVKWDLLLAQDKLGEAINVCNTLMQLFPDSTMADRALFKIALARMEGPNPTEAIGILAAVTALPKSDLKAEAQFKIGQILEAQALRDAEASGTEASLVGAMAAYKQCAEKYPDSGYAGESLAKIADYYIRTKDYARAIELMERVFQDYPDASFLDQMLGRWFIAAYRMGDMKMAKEKAQQLLSEYPNSKQAEAAKKVLDTLGSGEPPK